MSRPHRQSIGIVAALLVWTATAIACETSDGAYAVPLIRVESDLESEVQAALDRYDGFYFTDVVSDGPPADLLLVHWDPSIADATQNNLVNEWNLNNPDNQITFLVPLCRGHLMIAAAESYYPGMVGFMADVMNEELPCDTVSSGQSE